MSMTKRLFSETTPRLALLFFVSFIVHVGYVLSPIARANAYVTDDYIYLELGKNLLQYLTLVHDSTIFYIVNGHEPTMFWTPGYPLFVAFLLLCKSNPIIISLVQAVFTSFMVFPIYGIAKILFSGKQLWIVVSLWALYPFYVLLPNQIASENMAILLTILVTWLCVKPSQTVATALLCGVCMGILALTRPEFLAFSCVAFLWRCAQRYERLQSHVVRCACVLLAFCMLLVPWLARNHALSGRIVFTTRAAYSLVFENEVWYWTHSREAEKTRGLFGQEKYFFDALPAKPREIERYDYLLKRGVSYIIGHPLRYGAMCVKRAVSFSMPSTATSLIYRLFSVKDTKGIRLPPLWELSNLFFTLLLWLVVAPAAAGLLLRTRYTLDFFRGPRGLLLLLAIGQLAVSVAVIYTTYQRSIVDMFWIAFGLSVFFNRKNDGRQRQDTAEGGV
jgi:hypothetical protein